MTTTLRPGSEQVAIAWLTVLPDLAELVSGFTGDALPGTWDVSVGPPVYVQATTTAGLVSRYAEIRRPYVQIDAWAKMGRYGEVSAVAELIRAHTYRGTGVGELTVYPGYFPVELADVSAFTEPRQIREDLSRYARATQILNFTYTVKE